MEPKFRIFRSWCTQLAALRRLISELLAAHCPCNAQLTIPKLVLSLISSEWGDFGWQYRIRLFRSFAYSFFCAPGIHVIGGNQPSLLSLHSCAGGNLPRPSTPHLPPPPPHPSTSHHSDAMTSGACVVNSITLRLSGELLMHHKREKRLCKKAAQSNLSSL